MSEQVSVLIFQRDVWTMSTSASLATQGRGHVMQSEHACFQGAFHFRLRVKLYPTRGMSDFTCASNAPNMFFVSDHFPYQSHHHPYYHESMSSNPSMRSPGQALFKYIACLDLRVLWWWISNSHLTYYLGTWVFCREKGSFGNLQQIASANWQQLAK